MTSVRWPAEPRAFDSRLAEAMTLFATRARRPHIWPSVMGDQPVDLVDRLVANGFEDAGRGILMARTDLTDVTVPAPAPDVSLEVVRDAANANSLSDAALVLASSFASHGERDDTADTRDAAEIEAGAIATASDLGRVLHDPRVALVLVRVEGRPAAVAKITGGSGLVYLSSIGTRPALRGRGLAGLVTRAAIAEGARTGGRLAYLGVFEGNVRAQRLYARLGFEVLGAPVPDLLLVG